MEIDLTLLLQSATGATVYWDTTPEGFVPPESFIICHQVGGQAHWYYDRTVPSHKHARVLIKAFHARGMGRDALARQIEDAIRDSSLEAQPSGAPVKGYDPGIGRYESAQHFGIWYPDP